jgi:2,3-bisphosphoglycerate-dependent phosphoglycerate mutase
VTRDVATSPSTPTEPLDPPASPPPPDAFGRAFLTNVPEAGELILVRHGQQDFPADGSRRDRDAWVDPPLSALGVRQADAVGRALADRPLTAVYSSNLQRARETGEQVAGHHGLEVTVVDAVREIEMFRDLPEGVELLDAIDPLLLLGARERFALERRWDVWPFTETGDEFRHRVLMAVEGILATHPGERIAIACHGGVINIIAAAVLGVDEDMFFRPAHASFHRIGVQGARRVVWSLNETHHLVAEDLLSH